MPFIILELHPDLESAHIISDPDEPLMNAVFDTEEEAEQYAQIDCINPKIIPL